MNLSWVYLKCTSDVVPDWIPLRVLEEQSSLKDKLLTFFSLQKAQKHSVCFCSFFPASEAMFVPSIKWSQTKWLHESSGKSNSGRWSLMVLNLNCLLAPYWSLANFGIWRRTGTCLGSSLAAHGAICITSFIWKLNLHSQNMAGLTLQATAIADCKTLNAQNWKWRYSFLSITQNICLFSL